MARYPYNTTAWVKVVRPLVLERDGYVCRLGLPVCTRTATTVHHVIPVAHLHPRDPALLDPTNCVAACRECNSSLRDRVTPAPTRRGAAPSPRHRPPRPDLNTTRDW